MRWIGARLSPKLSGRGSTSSASPIISTASTASVNENAALAITLTADQVVSWSIVSGADQAQFEISGTTLRWALNGTQDYEAPADANADNAYVVGVRATNATTSKTTDLTITVTVNDVAEGGGTAGEPIGLLLTLTKAA